MNTLGSNIQHDFYQVRKKWGKTIILEKGILTTVNSEKYFFEMNLNVLWI